MTPDDEPPQCGGLFSDGRCVGCVVIGMLIAYAILAAFEVLTKVRP